MSFLLGGGGDIGSGRIVLGAVTSGLRSQVRGAVNEFQHGLTQMAGSARVEGGKTSASMNAVGRSADRMAAQTVAANERIAASSRGAAASTTAAHAQMGAAAKRAGGEATAAASRWDKAFGLIGSAAKLGIIGVVGALAIGIKSAATFEKDWAAVIKTVGGTPAQMEKLRAEFRKLATEMPVSVNELAKIGETAGALGIPIGQMKEFTRVVAQIGSTTNVSTEQAATSLGQLGNVLNLRQKDYERFGSTLVDLGNKGASTEKQILDIAARSGAAGKLLKLSTQEILAFASSAASLGIAPELAGTALQKTYLQMINVINGVGKATKATGLDTAALAKKREQLVVAEQRLAELHAKGTAQRSTLMAAENRVADLQRDIAANAAKGTTKAVTGWERLAKIAGMTAVEFKALWGRDSGQGLQAVLAGLGRMSEGDQLKTLADLGLKSSGTTRTLLGLANGSKEVGRQLGIAGEAWKANTALQEAYERKTANLQDRLKILGNVIKDQLITLGDAALPVLTKIVDFLSQNIPGALKTASEIWRGFVKAVQGPIGDLLRSFGSLAAAIGAAFSSDSTGKAADLGTVLKSAFGGVANVVGTLATGLARIVDLVTAFAKSDVGRTILQFVAPIVAAAAAISGVLALGRRLGGIAGGIGRGLFGFLPGIPGLGGRGKPPDVAMNEAARAHETAAGKLSASALAIEEMAHRVTAFNSSPMPGGLPPGGLTVDQQRIAAADAKYRGTGSGVPGLRSQMIPLFPRENSDLDTRFKLKNAALTLKHNLATMTDFTRSAVGSLTTTTLNAATSAKQLMGQARTAILDGVRAGASAGVNAVRAIPSGTMRLIRGVGSAVSKLFWPVLLLDMATEFLRAPIGDIVTKKLGLPNLGKRISEDFWGGMVDAITVAFNRDAGDAWVGHAEFLQIGTAKIKTIDVARMGFTSAEIGAIETPTLDNGGFTYQKDAARILREQYAGLSATDVVDKAITAGLKPEDFGLKTRDTDPAGKALGFNNGKPRLAEGYSRADVQPIVDRLIEMETGGVHDAFNGAVQEGLAKLGLKNVNVEDLPPDVVAKLGNLLGSDINGVRTSLISYLAKQAIAPFRTAGSLITAEEWRRLHPELPPLSPGPQTFGARPDVDTTRPDLNPARTPFEQANRRLTPVGGRDVTEPGRRQDTRPSAFRAEDTADSRRRQVAAAGAALRDAQPGQPPLVVAADKAFEANLANLLPKAKAIYQRFVTRVTSDPTGNAQATAAGAQDIVDTLGDQIKNAKSDKARLAVFNQMRQWLPDSYQTLAAGAKGPSKQQWDAVMAVYEDALAASGQSARDDYADLWKQIIRQGAADGSAKATPEAVNLFFTDYRAAIQAALNEGSTSNAQWSTALKGKKPNASLNTLLKNLGFEIPENFNASKFKTLGDAIAAIFKTEIPASGLANLDKFPAMFKDWAANPPPDPTKVGEMAMKISDIQTAAEKGAAAALSLGTAVGNLIAPFQTLGGVIETILKRLNGETLTPAGGGGGAAAHPAATGAQFDTSGPIHILAGEKAREHVTVLAQPKQINAETTVGLVKGALVGIVRGASARRAANPDVMAAEGVDVEARTRGEHARAASTNRHSHDRRGLRARFADVAESYQRNERDAPPIHITATPRRRNQNREPDTISQWAKDEYHDAGWSPGFAAGEQNRNVRTSEWQHSTRKTFLGHLLEGVRKSSAPPGFNPNAILDTSQVEFKRGIEDYATKPLWNPFHVPGRGGGGGAAGMHAAAEGVDVAAGHRRNQRSDIDVSEAEWATHQRDPYDDTFVSGEQNRQVRLGALLRQQWKKGKYRRLLRDAPPMTAPAVQFNPNAVLDPSQVEFRRGIEDLGDKQARIPAFASGAAFNTKGPIHVLAGEAEKEHVVVLARPRDVGRETTVGYVQGALVAVTRGAGAFRAAMSDMWRTRASQHHPPPQRPIEQIRLASTRLPMIPAAMGFDRGVSLPDMRFPSMAARIADPLAGRAAPTMKREQNIYADKLQILGPADERSLMHRLAFLGND